MLLTRLIKEGARGGQFARLADANTEAARQTNVEKYVKLIEAFCADDSREELIGKFAAFLHRNELSNIALEVALGGQYDSEKFAVITQLEELASLKSAVHARAKNGGAARSAQFLALEEETIRLFKAGKWTSVPKAALEITPKIVAMSKKGNGELSDATTKPLEWIRKYNRLAK